MGLGNFFKKLFGTSSESRNEPPPIEAAPDPIKDASDYYAPQPEIMSEATEPKIENSRAFADEFEEDIEDIRRADHQSDERIEEPAD